MPRVQKFYQIQKRSKASALLRAKLRYLFSRSSLVRIFRVGAVLDDDRLRALLDEEGCQVLDAMLEELFNEQSLEQAALFQATLSLCQELNQAGSR